MRQTPTDSSYYDEGGISVFDFIEAKGLNFALGNVVKYVTRAGFKDAETELEDLQKAAWYLRAHIDRLLYEDRTEWDDLPPWARASED